MDSNKNRRILLIDDNADIHEDYRKILCGEEESNQALNDTRAAFFGDAQVEQERQSFELDSAFQGLEGVEKVRAALEEGRPYAMAFVDVRMPPGVDGVETIQRLWEVDPNIQAVICTAFADYSWDEMINKLGQSDRLLILKKPFDPVEVCQLASSLTAKWEVSARDRERMEGLERAEREARNYADQAEAASRAKSEFLANMSHEIRTPMTAILGYADMLKDGDLAAPEISHHVETIRQNGQHLLAILNDILDISRIEAGVVTQELESCSPFGLMSSVRSMLKGRAEEQGLDLIVDWGGPIPEFIETDPTRLRQILINLVGNAIKFTKRGIVRIVVEFLEGDGLLSFDVSDSGCGISPDHHQSIFEAFNQADGSASRSEGGTGLGLTISKRLANMLGGDLQLKSSTRGEGSTFTLTVSVGDVSGARLLDRSSGSTKIHRPEPGAPLPGNEPQPESAPSE